MYVCGEVWERVGVWVCAYSSVHSRFPLAPFAPDATKSARRELEQWAKTPLLRGGRSHPRKSWWVLWPRQR